MSLEHALLFIAFAVVAAITPGPSNLMLTLTGALTGVVRGLPCLLGVAAGMALLMFVVAFGLGSVVLAYPTTLKIGGAAFLLWLAWKIATAVQRDPGSEARPVGFAGAFLFQWLNPKSWLVSASASATYLEGSNALWIAGLFFAVALVCGLPWLAAGAAMKKLVYRRGFNAAMGLLLAGSVLLFLR